jgi:tRNA pseudouridine55 synthase
VILIGQGTKLFPYLTGVDKEYEAVLRLGIETNTLDMTGQVVRTADVSALDSEFINRKASELVGEIEQVPPAFSAVRCQGKRAYELARKGVCPDLEKRVVRIDRLEITSTNLPDLGLSIRCSKGTYVRSLGAELGRRLGPGGHLISLRRVSSGPFRVTDAVELGAPEMPTGWLRDRIIPLRNALPHLKEIEVSKDTGELIEKGFPARRWADEVLPRLPDTLEGPVKIMKEGKLLAILKRLSPATGQECLELMRVFV